MKSNYDDVIYSQGYVSTEEFFRALTKNNVAQPYTFDQDFRSTNVNAVGEATNDVGYE